MRMERSLQQILETGGSLCSPREMPDTQLPWLQASWALSEQPEGEDGSPRPQAT